jgi:hypothetical protein
MEIGAIGRRSCAKRDVVHQARESSVDTDDRDDNVLSSAENFDDFDLTAF